MHLQSVHIEPQDPDQFPFTLQLIQNTREILFNSPVTFIVGENGSGKSTLLESMAVATRLPTLGAAHSDADSSLSSAKLLAQAMNLSWSVNTHRGFFMRAEDFFGFQKSIANLQRELSEDMQDFNERFIGYGRMLAAGTMQGQINALNEKYGENPDAFSHGESFLNAFKQRIVPKGLYILDEPEVPLSFQRQLSLMSMILDAVKNGSQFIIATHSPVLVALPDSEIYEISDNKLVKTTYDKLESIVLLRSFLESPERFIKYL